MLFWLSCLLENQTEVPLLREGNLSELPEVAFTLSSDCFLANDDSDEVEDVYG